MEVAAFAFLGPVFPVEPSEERGAGRVAECERFDFAEDLPLLPSLVFLVTLNSCAKRPVGGDQPISVAQTLSVV